MSSGAAVSAQVERGAVDVDHMLHERFARAAIGAVVLIGAAGGAQAYELQRTPDGEPVRWQSDELVFDLSGLDAAPQGVRIAARRALETWSAAGGPVLVDARGGAQGSIRWASEPGDPGVSPDVLAETHLSFDTETGAIHRAEIVINGAGFRWATDASGCSDAFDLESTLAHELGHALGLRHSEFTDATMFTRPAPCADGRRDLASDDMHAIDDLYATPPQLTPDDDATGGCSATGSRSSAAMMLLLVAAATLARSRIFLRR